MNSTRPGDGFTPLPANRLTGSGGLAIRSTIAWAVLAALAWVALLWNQSNRSAAQEQPPAVPTGVWFSPDGGCRGALVERIGRAGKSLHAAVYFFTDTNVSDALKKAAGRGVQVRLVLDGSEEAGEENGKTAARLKGSRVQIRFDKKHETMHNKYLIIDSEEVLTGSYNWTHFAETENAENVVSIREADVIAEFEKDFSKHWKHSELSPGNAPK